MNNEIDIKTLKPFTRFICTIGELPTSYVVSMSYEEQLLWLCNYLEKTVIPTLNNNSLATQELQERFIELKEYIDNYFDNLDIQEEVDNKLDEMAESGELEEIIAQYLELNTIKVFNTVDDLHDGDNLANGTFVETMGYNNIGDGGSAKYKIRTVTSEDVIDGYTIISLTNYPTLVAEIIIPDILNAHQFGIFGDNETDVTERLEKAMHYDLYLPKGTYLISERIGINNHKLYGDGDNKTIIKLKDNSTITASGMLRTDEINDYIIKDLTIDGNMNNISGNYNGVIIYNGTNIQIENVGFINQTGGAIKLNGSKQVNILNCTFKDSSGVSGATAPSVYSNEIKDLLISNCYCENIGDHFAYLCCDDTTKVSENIIIQNCILKTTGVDQLTGGSAICIYSKTNNVTISNCQILNCHAGIQVSNHNDVLVTPNNVTISNCIIKDNDLNGISLTGISNDRITNVNISSCLLIGNGQDAISLRHANNVTVNNCDIYNNGRYGIETRNNENITIYNCVAKNNLTAGMGFGSNNATTNKLRVFNCECYCDDSDRTQNTGIYLAYGSDMYVANCFLHDNTTSNIGQRSGNTSNVTIIGCIDPTTENYNYNSITFGSRIPTQNPHKVGDIVFYNQNNTSKLGAVCTSAGTPGTWREF